MLFILYHHYQFGKTFSDKMTRHVRHHFCRHTTYDEKALVSRLPVWLRVKFLMSENENIIEKIPILQVGDSHSTRLYGCHVSIAYTDCDHMHLNCALLHI